MLTYEYKFIKLDIGFFSIEPKEDYHEIIRAEGEQGWELVQIFVGNRGTQGGPMGYELIFKRTVSVPETPHKKIWPPLL